MLVVGKLLTHLLQVGRRYAGFFDKLGETMQRLGGNLDYLSRYARLFGHYVEVKNVSLASSERRYRKIANM